MNSDAIPSPARPGYTPLATSEMLTLVALHTQNAAIITDPDSRILWVNPGFTSITGYALEEVRGRKPGDFLQCPESDPAVIAEMRACIRAGRAFDVTLINRGRTGRRYWLNIEGRPIHNADGAIIAFMAIESDVTERVEREAALARSEAMLREAQRIARIGSWDYDPANRVFRWSEETFRIYGLPASDPAPDVDTGLAGYVESHRPIVETAFAQCLEMGVPLDVEALLRRSDGCELWVRSIGHAETKDGRIVRLMGAIQDIDGRKRAELEIARLADRMALAAQSAGIGIWEFDFITGKLIWDDAMLRLYGLSREQFTGELSHWENALHPDDHMRAKVWFAEATTGNGEFDQEFRIRLPDGRIRHLKAYLRIVRGPGGTLLSAAGVNYDVTREREGEFALRASEQNLLRLNTELNAAIDEARRLARDAEAANQAKSAFLANISHEIRTPLNGVIGITHILAGTPLSPDQCDFLRTIKLSGKTLLTLINDTLDYSEIEAGRVELERQPFDLVACVEEAIDLVAARAREKSLVIGPGVPSAVVGDATRLRQILVNLLRNAVKFTEHGAVTAEVEAHEVTPQGCTVSVHVRDTGLGIPKDKQAELFQRFHQVDASTTRTHGGTGLGLAISRGLAELMGGTLGVESEPGQGSVFTLKIPVLTASLSFPPFIPVPPATSERPGETMPLTVLMAEDNSVNQRVAQLILQRLGYDIEVVSDGVETLGALQRRAFDVILMDVHMPNMGGLAATRRIRARPEWRERPWIIALTAGAFEEDRRHALEAGMNDFLSKPLRVDQLKEALARAHRALHTPRPPDTFVT